MVILNVLLVVGIFGFFGIQIISLVVLIVVVGLVIGMVWLGLLVNLVVGGFIIVLWLFKVGDFICVGGVIGMVKEIGLFIMVINILDNVLIMVGNNKIFGDNIQNFIYNLFCWVELKVQFFGVVDYQVVIVLFRQCVVVIFNVFGELLVDVEIFEFNLVGLVLVVCLYCYNDYYWQVYFDINKVIKDVFGVDFLVLMLVQMVIVQQFVGV